MTKKYKQRFRKTKRKRGGAGINSKRRRMGTPALPEKLMPAAKRGDVATVASALRNPLTDPNMTGQYGYTALILAAMFGHAPVVTLLLADERVDPNMTNQNGKTALMLAAAADVLPEGDAVQGHAPVVTLLLADERVDPNIAGPGGVTALMIAVEKGHARVVRLLLADERVEPNMADEDGDTALMIAVEKGHARVVRLLLADERVNPNIATTHEETALMIAAKNNNAPVLELLLADHRTIRTRPPEDAPNGARAAYDTALFNVKYRRHARFKGLVRAIVASRRMRLRAAKTVYAPGGTGFDAAMARFNEARDKLTPANTSGTKKKKKKKKKRGKGTKRQGLRPKRKQRS